MKKAVSLLVCIVLIFSLVGCVNKDNVSSNKESQNTADITKWDGETQKPTIIILTRHGQTEYNLQGRYQGRLDILLNDKGLEQADKLAEYLKRAPIDVCISSPLQRARVTGEKVATYHNIPVSTDDRLVEIDFGDWTGCYKEDLKKNQPEAYKTWTETPWLFTMPNGESLEMMGTRGAEALKDIACKNAGKTVFIAAHSMFNQAVICELLGLGHQHFNQLVQNNTSISVLIYNGKWKMMMWNAIPHLDMVANGVPVK